LKTTLKYIEIDSVAGLWKHVFFVIGEISRTNTRGTNRLKQDALLGAVSVVRPMAANSEESGVGEMI
jgi:hypothetical protein